METRLSALVSIVVGEPIVGTVQALAEPMPTVCVLCAKLFAPGEKPILAFRRF